MLVLILLSVLLCCVYVITTTQRNKCTEPPVLPDYKPLIGHFPLKNLALNTTYLWQFLEKISARCQDAGGAATLFIGPSKFYVITDPEDGATVANRCLKKSDFYDYARDWLGDGLISADVPTWKIHRKLLNPAFSQSVLDSFIGVLNDQARKLVKDLEGQVDKGPFNHWPYLAMNGLDTIFNTTLGSDVATPDLEDRKKYLKALGSILNVIITRVACVWLHNDWMYRWSGLKKQERTAIKVLHDMSNKVLNQRKQEIDDKNNNKIKDSNSKFKPFLDLLLELGVDKKVFTDKQIREHVDTMIVAGHDTSANALMYCLALLGSHPQCQERVLEEIQGVLGSTDSDVGKHDLPRLVYTEAVIKEALRIYPIFPVLTRSIERDVQLKNYTLTAGRTCLIMLYGIHRHSSWGSDVHEFKPERWLDPATLPENPNAFAGFSIGRRGCLGKAYAMQSMKTTIVHIIRNYKVTAEIQKLKLKLGVMLKPESGHHITIEKRFKKNTGKAVVPA